MPNQEYVEDEISLRDYINVLIKRKKIILTVLFVAVITTAVASLLLPRVYQATTYIMIVPSQLETALSPTISIPTHQVLLESSIVLERIIDRLKLTDRLGKVLTPHDLEERLNIEKIKGTNILRLGIEDSKPTKAKKIANIWAEEYLKHAKATELGEVRIVSPAIEPEGTTRPRKKLNVALAGVVGLMFGVLLAFFQEYWAKSKR